ncbi:hypothetical protein [Amycolatopsis nigrescens]|uniref:hypothetical protein n=1 Tax=Amycolatopsis nigrescens TaxID=381445 RepID=UPI00037AD3C5|nr:hypothetical protein [Amycolatopsis nigrescens]
MRTDEPEIIEDYISGETVRAASYVKQVRPASTKAGFCLVDSDGIAATEDDLAHTITESNRRLQRESETP